jgi:hypothetical protein
MVGARALHRLGLACEQGDRVGEPSSVGERARGDDAALGDQLRIG